MRPNRKTIKPLPPSGRANESPRVSARLVAIEAGEIRPKPPRPAQSLVIRKSGSKLLIPSYETPD